MATFIPAYNTCASRMQPDVASISAGRHGDAPLLIKLPKQQDEGELIARRLKAAFDASTPWRDMAVLYRHCHTCKAVHVALNRLGPAPAGRRRKDLS